MFTHVQPPKNTYDWLSSFVSDWAIAESNSWPGGRATTRRPVDYDEELEESSNGIERHHHQQHHHQQQQHHRRQDNEALDGRSEEEENDESLDLSPPAGRDTLYQLTTERNPWRRGSGVSTNRADNLLFYSLSFLAAMYVLSSRHWFR